MEILPGRFHLRLFEEPPQASLLSVYIDTARYPYTPFAQDFGPVCLSSLYHFCKDVHLELQVR
jgi:hypothetical protein